MNALPRPNEPNAADGPLVLADGTAIPRYPRLADYSDEELHLLAKLPNYVWPDWVTDFCYWFFRVPDAEVEG